jgi:ornithine carbamoyltransferase
MTNALHGRDFLTMADLTPAELALVLDTAAAQKAAWTFGERSTPLAGRAVGVILQKPSMRTRISFEVAIARLGAHPVIMSGPDGAFSRGESVHDTAKVMERYLDAVVIRTFSDEMLAQFAEHCSVPVINALTDLHHPCQGLADLLTIREEAGQLDDVTLAYVGDGNNMANTYLLAGALAGMHVRVATPAGYEPASAVAEKAREIAATTGGSVALGTDARAAVAGADVVITDTWASMGQEDEHDARVASFEPFRVDDELMSIAPDAIFLHCLPAHRGEEVTDSVIDAPYSHVFDEAENRLHVQKALLSLVVG